MARHGRRGVAVETVASGRPDLLAHDRAVRMAPSELVQELRTHLGARLVAYLAGVGETRAVHQWADGSRTPFPPVIERLRLAHQVTAMLMKRDAAPTAAAWWQGLNPRLDDRSPARLLREGELEEVGPLILAAARGFAAAA